GLPDDQARRTARAIRRYRVAARVCPYEDDLQRDAADARRAPVRVTGRSRVRVVSSRIRTVRAPNASAMTLTGTNTYLIDGGGSLLCIDPGPAIPRHVDAILQAASSLGGRIEIIAL